VADAPLPRGLPRAHATVVLNRTLEPGVEALFTQEFRTRLQQAGALGGEADEARVDGEVLSLSGAPTVLDATGQLASYRLTATLRLRLVKNGQVLSDTTVTGTEDFLPDRQGADVLLTEQARAAALVRLAESLSREGFERLTAAALR
jgi:hypothetical protein